MRLMEIDRAHLQAKCLSTFYFLLSTFYFLLSTFYFILPLTAPQTSAKGLGPPAPLTLVHKNLQVKTLHPNEIDRL